MPPTALELHFDTDNEGDPRESCGNPIVSAIVYLTGPDPEGGTEASTGGAGAGAPPKAPKAAARGGPTEATAACTTVGGPTLVTTQTVETPSLGSVRGWLCFPRRGQ